mmetsp:Transcript_8203/g.16901  ORF Transcript_8203/g.16901 Transcript_8203/m.16901 type:complete len:82 (-) Transcript_8203:332-577(-)
MPGRTLECPVAPLEWAWVPPSPEQVLVRVPEVLWVFQQVVQPELELPLVWLRRAVPLVLVLLPREQVSQGSQAGPLAFEQG